MKLRNLLSGKVAENLEPWDQIQISPEELKDEAPSIQHPAPLVGPDLDSIIRNLQKSIEASGRRLAEIDMEINRLKVERSKTSIVLASYEEALKVLHSGVERTENPIYGDAVKVLQEKD